MRRRSFHLVLIGLVVLPLILAALVGMWMGLNRSESPPSADQSPTASLPPARKSAAPPTPADAPSHDAPEQDAAEDAAAEPSAPADPLDTFDAGGWEAVDLDRVRAALPGNLYWTLSAPTKDAAIIEARRAERDRWNVEYGKVLSNTATAEEVDAYYLQRKRLSSDYIEFATHLLVNYGTKLPKRDVGLLKLAVDMHLTRLQEIPGQLAEAHERRIAHDAARRAWLEDQKAFDDANVP